MAKNLLAQAGFPVAMAFLSISLLYYTGDPTLAATVQAIQSDVSQLGITVNLEGVTRSKSSSILVPLPRESNYPDLIMLTWQPDFAYPDDYAYSLLNGASFLDGPNLNNTLINNWTSKAINEPNFTIQAQMYSDIASLEQQLSSYVWLWQYVGGLGVPGIHLAYAECLFNPILYGFNYSAMSVS